MQAFVIESGRTLRNLYQESQISMKTVVAAVEDITQRSLESVTPPLIESIKILQDSYNQVPPSAKTAIIIGGVTLAAPYIVPLALHPLGWTATGVKAGTAASAWQSTMGGTIMKGGLFSYLQKTAMTTCVGLDPKIPMAIYLIAKSEVAWVKDFLQDKEEIKSIEGIAVQ